MIYDRALAARSLSRSAPALSKLLPDSDFQSKQYQQLTGHWRAGRELKQDLSSITNLASGSGLGNIAGGSGFNAGSITSALSGLAGGGGGFTNLAR